MRSNFLSSFSSMLTSSLWWTRKERRSLSFPTLIGWKGGKVEHIIAFIFDKSEIQNTNNCAGDRINEYEVIVKSSK